MCNLEPITRYHALRTTSTVGIYSDTSDFKSMIHQWKEGHLVQFELTTVQLRVGLALFFFLCRASLLCLLLPYLVPARTEPHDLPRPGPAAGEKIKKVMHQARYSTQDPR